MELSFDYNNPKYKYITEDKDIDKALEFLEKEQVVGLDVESTTLDPYTGVLRLVQIAARDISYIFDAQLLHLKDNKRYISYLENPKIVKVMHNGKFDYGYLKIQTNASVKNIFDLMLAESVLTSGLRGKYPSLKELARDYLNLQIDKEVRKSFVGYLGKITEEQLKYASNDTLIMFPIMDMQLEKLRKDKLINIAKLEFAVTTVVAEMELKGIYINSKKWRKIMSALGEKRDTYYRNFQEIIRPFYSTNQMDIFGNLSDSINMNSQQQLMDLFNNKLGISIPSTGDAILESVNHPVAKALREYRGYEKLLSAFGDSLLAKINSKTGRMHPSFNQLGTATGRFSCQDPNLQQIPRNSQEAPFRECFNPAEGYKLVVADYSSFEMRILADLSGDEKMLYALNNGLDIHSYTASLMFNMEYTKDFKKLHPLQRQIAKPIGFGLMYGMGPVGLIGRIRAETGEDITKEDSQEYINKFFASYPSVRGFLDKVAREALSKGYSITPAGRKRWYNKPEPDDPEYRRKVAKIQREAKNHPIQGTNADAIKFALVFVENKMKKEGIDGGIILTVHDEIVSEVREDQADDWAKLQSEEMVRAGELFLKHVKVISEPFVGDVWEH